MQPQNGVGGIDALAANLRTVGTYIAEHPPTAGETRAPPAADKQPFVARVRTAITRHPFAAIGLAFGLGYLVIRAIRR